MQFLESSFDELYDSTVDAFPHTTKRQHATHLVEVKALSVMPFVGMKTLLAKAQAQSIEKEYNTFILFKGVNFQPEHNAIKIKAGDGGKYLMERFNLEDTQISVRCNCKDFFWRFHHYDHVDKSLYGKNRAKYEALTNQGPANPKELPGMCKHLIKMFNTLYDEGLFTR